MPESINPHYQSQNSERRRCFNDADGVQWDVREIRNHDYDRRGGYCLIFETAGIIRRVRQYPADWYRLSPDALYALSLLR